MPYKDPEKRRACSREASKRWLQKDPARAAAVRKRNYDKYREKKCAKSRAWYHANKERVLQMAWARNLRRRYGLTIAQYEAMGKACAICGSESDSRDGFRLSVDHDAETGRVRGLLCGNCNCGIGYFKHDEQLMQKAIVYLRTT